jgi:LSD1 subclass zinc finger protein
MIALGLGDHRQGCVVCGVELDYLPGPKPVRCAVCGTVGESPVRCREGHFVCDACHAAPAADVIERACLASDATDPVVLATRLMRHPSVKLHGPEHHFLVPAVLVTAFCNARGQPGAKAGLLAEARRRSAAVAGGFCGFQGACGAGVGVGIFASLATGATPLARESWGLANSATAGALTVIGRLGGPRCCKRTSWLALLSGIRLAREELGVRLDGRGPACEWSEANAECLEKACPFHPARRSAA